MVRDLKNFAAGATLLGLGSFFLFQSYRLGLGQSGAGHFPALVAVITIVIGVALLVLSAYQAGPSEPVEWRQLVFVCLSIFIFGACIRLFGLVPTTILSVLLAAYANPVFQLRKAIVAGIIIAIGAWLIFAFALGIHIPAFAFLEF